MPYDYLSRAALRTLRQRDYERTLNATGQTMFRPAPAPTRRTGETAQRYAPLAFEVTARPQPRILPSPAYAIGQLVWLAGQKAMITKRERAGRSGKYVYLTDLTPHGAVSESALQPVGQELPLDREENWIPPVWFADNQVQERAA